MTRHRRRYIDGLPTGPGTIMEVCGNDPALTRRVQAAGLAMMKEESMTNEDRVTEFLEHIFQDIQGGWYAAGEEGTKGRVAAAVYAASGVLVGRTETMDLHPIAALALYEANGDDDAARALFLERGREWLALETWHTDYVAEWVAKDRARVARA